MTRRYGVLLVAMLVAGLLLVWAGHARRRVAEPARAAAVPVAARLAITVRDSSVEPASVVVPENSRVRLTVRNAGSREARFALAGYEGRFPAVTLGPGESAEREFTADLPGDDFPWLVNGTPAGRFQVQGSHLVEGHR